MNLLWVCNLPQLYIAPFIILAQVGTSLSDWDNPCQLVSIPFFAQIFSIQFYLAIRAFISLVCWVNCLK